MLSGEKIEELWVAIHKGKYMSAGFNTFARAIEAECVKVPEGWVAVPRIVTPAIEAVYSNDSGAYGTAQELHEAMLAAVPKPAQAEKQEPVKGEPVAWCVAYDDPRMGRIHSDPSMCKPELEALISRAGSPLELVPLYTRPHPENTLWQATAKSLGAEVDNLTAEVERLTKELRIYHEADAKAAAQIHQQTQRIAELEEAAREAREALQYHTAQTRPIFNTTEAIAKLDAVLGNAIMSVGFDITALEK